MGHIQQSKSGGEMWAMKYGLELKKLSQRIEKIPLSSTLDGKNRTLTIS